MVCDECKKKICLCALSEGTCIKCGEPTPTPHQPSYKVCLRCSAVHKVCEQCGKKLDK